MKVKTNRFGSIEVSREDIIFFPEGILGFSKYKNYFLVESNINPYFLWLQSIDNGNIAFPLLEPQLFKLDYKAEFGEDDKKLLCLDKEGTRSKILSIITLSDDPALITANLRAPIVINLTEALAKQIVLSDTTYQVNYPVADDLKRMMAHSSNDLLAVENEECHVYRCLKNSEAASDLIL